MKRFVLLILLLAMALSMTGCLTVTGDNDQPDELPPEEQHLTADVDETEVWHRRHDDVWSGWTSRSLSAGTLSASAARRPTA